MEVTAGVQTSDGLFRAWFTQFLNGQRVWTDTGVWRADKDDAINDMQRIYEAIQ